MVDMVVLAVILLIIGGAVSYIVKLKKSGARCVGCSMAGKCSGHCGGATGSENINYTDIEE